MHRTREQNGGHRRLQERGTRLDGTKFLLSSRHLLHNLVPRANDTWSNPPAPYLQGDMFQDPPEDA
jgi:hypothetical protein